MLTIRAQMNRIIEEDDLNDIPKFNKYIYSYLSKKYNNCTKKAEAKILNLLLTLDFYKEKHSILKIFSKIVNHQQEECDLSCFQFLRSLSEKELNMSIISKHREKVLSLDSMTINNKQANRIMKNFLGDNPNIAHETFIKRFVNDKKKQNKMNLNSNQNINFENSIKPYELFLYSLTEYKKFRDHLKVGNNEKTTKSIGGENNPPTNYIDSCLYQTFSSQPLESVTNLGIAKENPAGNMNTSNFYSGVKERMLHSAGAYDDSYKVDSHAGVLKLSNGNNSNIQRNNVGNNKSKQDYHEENYYIKACQQQQQQQKENSFVNKISDQNDKINKTQNFGGFRNIDSNNSYNHKEQQQNCFSFENSIKNENNNFNNKIKISGGNNNEKVGNKDKNVNIFSEPIVEVRDSNICMSHNRYEFDMKTKVENTFQKEMELMIGTYFFHFSKKLVL